MWLGTLSATLAVLLLARACYAKPVPHAAATAHIPPRQATRAKLSTAAPWRFLVPSDALQNLMPYSAYFAGARAGWVGGERFAPGGAAAGFVAATSDGGARWRVWDIPGILPGGSTSQAPRTVSLRRSPRLAVRAARCPSSPTSCWRWPTRLRGWKVIISYQEPWIDTTSPFGEAMFGITAGWAQMERVKVGMERTRREGRRLGRPRVTANPSVMRDWPMVRRRIEI